MDYGHFVPICLSAIPGLAVATKILQVNRFRLWTPGKLMIALVTTFAPSISTVFAHEFIKKDMLLEQTPCSVCLETRAVSFQMISGVIFPSIIGIMAANQQLVGQAWKPEWIRGFCIVKKDLLKCKNIVIGNAIMQATVVSILLHFSRNEWWHVKAELKRRKQSDPSRLKSSKIITNAIRGI